MTADTPAASKDAPTDEAVKAAMARVLDPGEDMPVNDPWPFNVLLDAYVGLRADGLALAAHVAALTSKLKSLQARLEDVSTQLEAERARSSQPIKMILFCPACGLQHIDEPSPPIGVEPTTGDGGLVMWTNPPHRSHLCHGCGHIWRPADVATEGVARIETVGKADSPRVDPQASLAALTEERDRLREGLEELLNLDRVAALRARAEAAEARAAAMEAALEEISGHAPVKTPPDYATSSDTGEAFDDGYSRGVWEMGQIADAALAPQAEAGEG